MRWVMVRVGVPLSTAPATRATVSPGLQRQASACAHTSAKFSGALGEARAPVIDGMGVVHHGQALVMRGW